MAEEPARPPNPAGRLGLLDNLLGLASAVAGFFESRFALITRDSKVALVQMLALIAFCGAAVMLFALGYIFLIVSAIVGLAHLVRVPWLWTALAAAGLHFLLALVFVLLARARLTKPLFRATASELKKDREWLKNLDTTTRPSS
jgi:uncharacterized membrane protein YqjE